MGRLTLLTDEELDELLAGRTAEGQRDLAPLADIAATIRSRARAEPAPVMGYELRRAMAAGSAPPARRMPRRALDVVAATVAIFSLGAVSAAGALPAALQNAVSNAGGLVGLTVHCAHEADERARDAVPEGGAADEDTATDGAGPPDVTPGGAVPADPGTPTDEEPATPATPPAQSSGGRPDSVPAADQADDPGSAGRDKADQRGENGDAGQDRRPEDTPVTSTTEVVDDALDGSKASNDRIR